VSTYGLTPDLDLRLRKLREDAAKEEDAEPKPFVPSDKTEEKAFADARREAAYAMRGGVAPERALEKAPQRPRQEGEVYDKYGNLVQRVVPPTAVDLPGPSGAVKEPPDMTQKQRDAWRAVMESRKKEISEEPSVADAPGPEGVYASPEHYRRATTGESVESTPLDERPPGEWPKRYGLEGEFEIGPSAKAWTEVLGGAASPSLGYAIDADYFNKAIEEGDWLMGALSLGGMAAVVGPPVGPIVKAVREAAEVAPDLKDDANLPELTLRTFSDDEGALWYEYLVEGEPRWINSLDLNKASMELPSNTAGTGPAGVAGGLDLAIHGGFHRSGTRSAAPVAEGARDLPSPPTTIAPKVTETFKAAQEGDQAAQTAAKQMLGEAAEAKQLWREMGTDSPYFQKWFGESAAVDDAGKPLVVYHGTPHDFQRFERGSSESAFGSAMYFSDNVDDINRNYARIEGPDVQNRVGQVIDQIESLDDFDADDILEAARSLEQTPELRKLIEAGDVDALVDAAEPDLIEAIARQQVLGDQAFSVMPVYLQVKNPVYLDPSGKKGRTVFEFETIYDEAGDVIDEQGSAVQLLETLDDVAREFDAVDEVGRFKEALWDDLADGEIDALTLMSKIRDEDFYEIIDPDTGLPAATEFLRTVFERMGFDGIIADAHHFFGPRRGAMGTRLPGMEGVTPGTYHYMMFEPTQIKSRLNKGMFDPKNPDIQASLAGALDDSSRYG